LFVALLDKSEYVSLIFIIAIGILKASADFTREQCYAFLIPVYITLMQIAFLAIWLTTLLYVFSSASKV
jgi:hypothetical protein